MAFMKLGIEVEGKFIGQKTLFCGAAELSVALAKLPRLAVSDDVVHLYVSDHENTLSQEQYDLLGSIPYRVTVEVRQKPVQPRYCNVAYMIAVEIDPRCLGFFDTLAADDQIKFTSNLYVACASMSDFDQLS